MSLGATHLSLWLLLRPVDRLRLDELLLSLLLLILLLLFLILLLLFLVLLLLLLLLEVPPLVNVSGLVVARSLPFQVLPNIGNVRGTES